MKVSKHTLPTKNRMILSNNLHLIPSFNYSQPVMRKISVFSFYSLAFIKWLQQLKPNVGMIHMLIH